MSRPSDLLRMGLRQVIRRPGRLAGVGAAIALGTAGLILVVTAKRDVKDSLADDLEVLGMATVVRVGLDPHQSVKEGFLPRTVAAVRATPGVRDVGQLAMDMAPACSYRGRTRHVFTLIGTDAEFWRANGITSSQGSLYDAESVRQRRRECVLGGELAARLFGAGRAVGSLIRIDRDLYRVRGLLAPGLSTDYQNMAFIPLTTARDRVPALSPMNRLYIRCASWDDVERVAKAVPAAVAGCQATDRLRVEVAWDALTRVQRIAWWVELFARMSVVVTLALGGFGMWHGMMASVVARTREIGLKKAMGAEDADIMAQFLVESLCLSLGASVLGVALGRGAMAVVYALLGRPPTESVFLASVGLSLLVSLVLGVGAGFYPALRASRMDVVSAVRYE
jgi:putative ABC transport system permease protein